VTTTPENSDCPGCDGDVPKENESTGEGLVYWKVTNEAFCSMECVVKKHRQWLKEQKSSP
jgi:hypothetical protein